MPKARKSLSKRLRELEQMSAFISSLIEQQRKLGGFDSWAFKYRQKNKI